MDVTFHQRKPRAGSDHSVENVFEDVRRNLKGEVNSRTVICPFESRGVFRRMANMAAAALRQGAVNHVTGDVNYVGFSCQGTAPSRPSWIAATWRAQPESNLFLKTLWVSLPIRNCVHVTVISEATRKDLLRHVKCDPCEGVGHSGGSLAQV